MRPYVQLVESFRKEYQRLPTESEYDTLVVNHYDKLPSNYNKQEIDTLSFDEKLSYYKGVACIYARRYSSIPDFADFPYVFIDWKTNYVIGFWQGEWFEFYISQTNNYTIDDYPSQGIWGLLVNCLIGLIPLVLLTGKIKLRDERYVKKVSSSHFFLIITVY